MLHDVLWRSSFHLAQSCLLHPFVRALGDGTLPADLFRAYIAQDAFFLRAFAQVYALALARSSDLEAIALYSELIGGVQEELNLHRVYTAELAIDLGSVVPNPACRAYTDFLLRTAWHNSLGETLAAITPWPNRPRREPPGHAVDRITVLAQEIQELLDLVAL